MKILIVSAYLPHPHSGHGTGVVMYGFISRLCERHKITLVSFCDRHELALAKDLASLPLEFIPVPRGMGAKAGIGWVFYLILVKLLQYVRSILFWQPMYVSGFWHPRMGKFIQSLTAERGYDIVQFEMTSMAQYRPSVVKGRTILHEHDVALRPAYREYKHSPKLIPRLLKFLAWCRWASYERRVLARFDHIFCVTQQDTLLLGRLFSLHEVSYLPRGVDIPDPITAHSDREPATLLFVGTFAHPPNVDSALWLVRDILPRVRKIVPEARLVIIGKNPPGELRLLAEEQPEVRVPGFVEDIESYYRKASLFVAPLRFGGGVKVKILHAMARGLPVVTTKIGSEGIDELTPAHIAVGRSAAEFAEHIVVLLGDPARAERMGMNGRELMRRNYSWKTVFDSAERVYQPAL